MWALSWADHGIERAQSEAIKLSIDESGRVLLVLAFAWETRINSVRWGSEVIVTVDFDTVRLAWGLWRDHAEADALVGAPHEGFEALLCGLSPDELSDPAARG